MDVTNFIQRSSAVTAEIFRIPKRGKIKTGFYADIILFDPLTFSDKADYDNAFEFAEGLEFVIMNGKLSVENGEFNGSLNGRVLRKEKD